MDKYKFLVFTVFLLFIFYFQKMGIDENKIYFFIKNGNSFTPIFFIFIYAILPVFFFPITPLSIIGGIIFGPLWGTLYSVIGASFGASSSFFISRYLMKDWINKKSPENVIKIKEKINKGGWKAVVMIRIIPILPFNAQNYIFGVTDISFKIFIITSVLTLIPFSFFYVYLGYMGRNIIFPGF